MSLGERLIFAREKKGLTQKKLSELLEITPTRLNYWEKNKREPSVEMIFKISQILGISTDFLIGLESLTQIKDIELPQDKQNLLNNYDKLNEVGKEKAIERVEELTQIPKYISSNNITEFPTAQEDTSDKVRIIARGKGITYIDREEFEEIKRNSKQLTDDEISDFLD